MYIRQIIPTFLALTVLLCFSCKKDNPAGTGSIQLASCTIGSVQLDYPDKTTGIINDADIIITFASAVDTASAKNEILLKRPDNTIVGARFAFTNGNTTVIIDPLEALDNLTDYKLSVTSLLKGNKGETFKGIIYTFTTAESKEDPPVALTLLTLTSGNTDMNGTVAATVIAISPTIVAGFSTAINPATANNVNIFLTRVYDNANIPLTIGSAATSVTIVPGEILTNGTSYKLSFGAGLKSDKEQPLTALTRNFTTMGTFAPSGAIAYWNFENNANDQVGTYNPSSIIDIIYTASRSSAAGQSATFNGTSSIIEIPFADQLMNTHDFTLSFWAKAVNSNKSHFIMGLAVFYGFEFELGSDFMYFKMPVQFDYGDGTSGTGGDLHYNGDGSTKDNGGWKGTTFCRKNNSMPDILKEKWFHITYVYNSATKEKMFYLNGELVMKQDYNLYTSDLGGATKEMGIVGLKYAGVAPETVNELAFGFIQSRAGTLWDGESWAGYDFAGANHFKGQLDDVRIYHKTLTAVEIDLMYKSEKP